MGGSAEPMDNSADSCGGVWDQCGGGAWDGSTCCSAGTKCEEMDEWFSQVSEWRERTGEKYSTAVGGPKPARGRSSLDGHVKLLLLVRRGGGG